MSDNIKTGFKGLDNILGGGLKRGEVVFVASRPGVGKTALALNILSNIARDGGSCALFSLDSAQCDTADNYKNLAVNRINFYDNSRCSIEQISSICRAFLEVNKKIDVIAIDYLQLLNRVSDDVTCFYNSIKALAKELNICVIVLSQVGRTASKQAKIVDLKEVFPFAIKADSAIILNRPDTTATREELAKGSVKKGETTLTVYKNCDKPLGEVSLLFDSDNLKFFDFDN
jgi:replicative DNA helicase